MDGDLLDYVARTALLEPSALFPKWSAGLDRGNATALSDGRLKHEKSGSRKVIHCELFACLPRSGSFDNNIRPLAAALRV